MLERRFISSEKLPDGSLCIRYDSPIWEQARSMCEEVFSQEDRQLEARVLRLLSEHYGYVKPIRCKECGSFIPMLEDVSDKEPGVCSYFKIDVPCEHYCSYAWKDEDDE